jgi:hypothetical protein
MEILNFSDIENYDVIGGGVIIYSRKDGEIYLLLGREACITPWEHMFLYSEFGGGIDEGETSLDGIIREFYEETQGFFGDESYLKEKVTEDNKKCIYMEENKSMYLFYEIEYDKNVERYYRNNYLYYEKMVKNEHDIMKYFQKGYFEKDMITYFPLNNKQNCLMRDHFQKIMEFILSNKNILF